MRALLNSSQNIVINTSDSEHSTTRAAIEKTDFVSAKPYIEYITVLSKLNGPGMNFGVRPAGTEWPVSITLSFLLPGAQQLDANTYWALRVSCV